MWLMAALCRVCAHPRKDEIEQELTMGKPIRQLAGKYLVTPAQLRKHALHQTLAISPEERRAIRSTNIVKKIRHLEKAGLLLQKKCEVCTSLQTAVLVFRERVHLIEILDGVLQRAAAQSQDTALDALPSELLLQTLAGSPLAGDE
jgi:hypothetical protein